MYVCSERIINKIKRCAIDYTGKIKSSEEQEMEIKEIILKYDEKMEEAIIKNQPNEQLLEIAINLFKELIIGMAAEIQKIQPNNLTRIAVVAFFEKAAELTETNIHLSKLQIEEIKDTIKEHIKIKGE